ncbi:serpin B6-like [Callorhinchus milii]|uniref:serpin B6-like n=1 Tax=Callorhinchus milii TaxID=7868 RepID=UPI001C3FA703|nr:serpin B6-like [Callorhinchus milii]
MLTKGKAWNISQTYGKAVQTGDESPVEFHERLVELFKQIQMEEVSSEDAEKSNRYREAFLQKLIPEIESVIAGVLTDDMEWEDLIKIADGAYYQRLRHREAKIEGRENDPITDDYDYNGILIFGYVFSMEGRNDPSYRFTNETKPVQMMCQKEEFKSTYIREVETRILELPYVQKELSMIIMLPDLKGAASGLQKLQNGLTFDKLLEWTNPDKMYNDEIEVMLNAPQFKMENTYDFTSTLGVMGMVDAFDALKANFSGMTEKNDLILLKVVHKTFVEVHEEDTEGAAVTAAILMLRCAMITVEFVADYPFLLFIRHNKTHNILFFGSFSSP